MYMKKETEQEISLKNREKLKIRLYKALDAIKMIENRMSEYDIKQVEGIYASIEEEIDIRETGSSWRSWYPMSGTIDEIEKDLK